MLYLLIYIIGCVFSFVQVSDVMKHNWGGYESVGDYIYVAIAALLSWLGWLVIKFENW